MSGVEHSFALVRGLIDQARLLRGSERDALVEQLEEALRDLRAGQVPDSPAAQAWSSHQIQILDCARDAILICDLSRRILFWNRGAEEIYGWPAAEAGGRLATELLATGSPAPIDELLASLRRDGSWEGELVHRHRDGGEIVVESRWTLLRDADGGEAAILEIDRDVTARREIERENRRLTRDLQRRLHEIETLFQVVPVGLAIASDPACRHIRANREFARQLGISTEVNASLSAPDAERPGFRVLRNGRPVAPEDLPMQLAAARAAEIHDLDYEVVRQDGRLVILNEYAAPLFDEDGRVRGAVGAFLDITERKRAEDDLRFLAQASRILSETLDLRATVDAVVRLALPRLADYCVVHLMDEHGRPLQFAFAHRDAAKEPVLREVARSYEVDLQNPASILADVLQTGRTRLVPHLTPDDARRITPDPEHLRRFERLGARSYLCVPLVAPGRVNGAISLVMSESGRIYDDRHAALAEELARTVSHAIENARLFAQAEAANRIKDEFLATLSHELRTPLNAMVGWIHLLRSGRLDPKGVQQALSALQRSADSQAQIVADLLDVSRIITGRLGIRLRDVVLADVVQAAVDSVRPPAESKGIVIVVRIDPEVGSVRADPTRLQQIIWNLVSNAIKFTPRGGEVSIRATVSGDDLEIAVQDSGDGIDPDFLPFVFDRFRQADGGTGRAHGGLGLGLGIVRHLVELHGGVVSASSPGPGRGSTFTVRIPRRGINGGGMADGSRAPARTSSSFFGGNGEVESPADLSGLSVLVVDDDEDGRTLASLFLSNAGARVRAAASAEEARALLRADRPDVLLVDISMPHEDGYSLLSSIRAWRPEDGGEIPAIALTAFARAEDRARAIASGFHAHLSKPVSPATLTRAVAGLRSGAPETPG